MWACLQTFQTTRCYGSKKDGVSVFEEKNTLPETNIAPENGWLEVSFGMAYLPIFRGYVSF